MSERRIRVRPDFWVGAVESLPIQVALAPIGALFGTLAVGNGLSTPDAVLMSALVFAGASQMVAIDLYGAEVPAWSILLSVFAVNFRHLLYSAAITRIVRPFSGRAKAAAFFFLVDPVYAASERRAVSGRRVTVAWYFGFATFTYANWVAWSAAGAMFGRLVENAHALALDMVLPIYFLALLLGFRGRPRWGPVVAASALVATLVYHAPAWGLTWLGSPWHIALGALAGILVAAAGPVGVPRRPLPAGEGVRP